MSTGWFNSVRTFVAFAAIALFPFQGHSQNSEAPQGKVELELPLSLLTQTLVQQLTAAPSPITEIHEVELSLYKGFARIRGEIAIDEKILKELSPTLPLAPIPSKGSFSITVQTGLTPENQVWISIQRFRFAKIDLTDLMGSVATVGAFMLQDPLLPMDPKNIQLDSIYKGLTYDGMAKRVSVNLNIKELIQASGLDKDPRIAPFIETPHIWEARLGRSDASDEVVIKLTVAN